MDLSSGQPLPQVHGPQSAGAQLQTSNLVQFELVERLLRAQKKVAQQQQEHLPQELRRDRKEVLQPVAVAGGSTKEVRPTPLPKPIRHSVAQAHVPRESLRWSSKLRFGFSRKTSRPLTILIEGNIGCGKTTFTKNFLDDKNILTLVEPIEEYRNVAGVNLLEKMYKNPSRYAYQFQHHAMMMMKKMHTTRTSLPTKIMERSIFSCNCFVEAKRRIGQFEDVEAHLLTESVDHCEVDLIVYLRLSPEKCYSRVRSRARHEEAEVPLEYLEALHEVHEDWLIRDKFSTLPAPVLILDAEMTADEVFSNFCEVMCA